MARQELWVSLTCLVITGPVGPLHGIFSRFSKQASESGLCLEKL